MTLEVHRINARRQLFRQLQQFLEEHLIGLWTISDVAFDSPELMPKEPGKRQLHREQVCGHFGSYTISLSSPDPKVPRRSSRSRTASSRWRPRSRHPAPKAAPGPESAPHSGIGLTRADYERERRKAERLAAEEAEAAKAKPSTPIDVVHEDDDDAPSAFRKREPA